MKHIGAGSHRLYFGYDGSILVWLDKYFHIEDNVLGHSVDKALQAPFASKTPIASAIRYLSKVSKRQHGQRALCREWNLLLITFDGYTLAHYGSLSICILSIT